VDKLKTDPLTRRLVKAAVGPLSALTGKTIREFGFRTRFDAVVVAVHRDGELLYTPIGEKKHRWKNKQNRN
jgi:K+/H+ antiporter YhaU regulatory subunit KhtT